jgi:hypothetical protein
MPEVEDITDEAEDVSNAVEELYTNDDVSSDILEGNETGEASSSAPKKLPVGLFEPDPTLPPLPSHPAEALKMGDLSQVSNGSGIVPRSLPFLTRLVRTINMN